MVKQQAFNLLIRVQFSVLLPYKNTLSQAVTQSIRSPKRQKQCVSIWCRQFSGKTTGCDSVIMSSILIRYPNFYADIAQLVEHLFEAQGVGGSIPSIGTKYSRLAQRQSTRLISDRSVIRIHYWEPSFSPISIMVLHLFCNQVTAVRFCHGAPSFYSDW